MASGSVSLEKTADASDMRCLVGTPLEGITLEQLLQNVEDNEIGTNEEEICHLKEKAAEMYHLYMQAKTLSRKELILFAQKRKIPLHTLEDWRYNVYVPFACKNYLFSFLPQNTEQKAYFVYLLGVAARSDSSEKSVDRMTRRFSTIRIRNRYVRAVKTLSREEPKINGLETICAHPKFLRVLTNALKGDYCKYILNDED